VINACKKGYPHNIVDTVVRANELAIHVKEFFVVIKPAYKRIPLTHFLPADPDLRNRTSAVYRKNADRLRASIREYGIIVPLLGYWEGEKVRIIDGMTRWLEGFQAGIEDAAALIYEEKPEGKQLDFAKIIVNDVRTDLTKIEKLDAMLETMKRYQLSLSELAKNTFKSRSQVWKDLSIVRHAIEPVKEMMMSGVLCGRQTTAISRLPAEEQLEMAKKAVNWAAETTEDKVAERLGGKKANKKQERIKAKGAFATIMEGVESAKALVVEINKWIKQAASTP
jgi:ParB/RepB/Spo0J family partition protein